MARQTSDSEFLELYRQALANHEQDLVDFLKEGAWEILLTKLNPSALTDREWADISRASLNKEDIAQSRASIDKEEMAKRVISKIRTKDTLPHYIAFSRALCDRTHFDKDKIFPFVSDLEKDGRHCRVKRSKRRRGQNWESILPPVPAYVHSSISLTHYYMTVCVVCI